MGSPNLIVLPSPRTTGSDDELWDIRRACAFLGMSKYWMYRAVAAGKVPHRKIGSAIRFIPAELRAWALRQPGSPGA
jgi:predicted DNA-binding transcriptional regulator AlpA